MDAPIAPERRAAVEAACRSWINRLIDPSRRNNLLFFRHLQEGTLDLTASPADAIAKLIGASCDPVKIGDLVKAADVVTVSAKLQEIRKRALINQEERGLDTMFLALGTASWPASDDGRPYSAPILLMPIAIEQIGMDRRGLTLARAGDLQVNLVLLHYLESQNVQIDAEQLVELVEGDDRDESFNLTPAFDYLRNAAAGKIADFSVTPHFIVGNFSFQKMAMVRDLRELLEALVRHDLIAAIAKDPTAAAAVRASGGDAQLPHLDDVRPDQEFLVLDADSTQQRAIAHALTGQNGVISGPPGTGKSQTIANLIAESAAQGRRVLFVAEKRAALDAVLKRLEQKGLAHLCLDLHGADVSRRQVLERVGQGLERVRDARMVNSASIHQRFEERRSKLNDHVRRLHAPRHPSTLSIYQLQGRLLRLTEAESTVRWRGAALKQLTEDRRQQVIALLDEASGFAGLFTGSDTSPWTRAVLSDGQEAQRALDIAAEVARKLPSIVEHVSAACRDVGLPAPGTLAAVDDALALLADLNKTLTVFQKEIFERNLQQLAVALKPARKALSRLWAVITDAAYRQAASDVRRISMDAQRAPGALLSDAIEAERVQSRWTAAAGAGSIPQAWAGSLPALQGDASTVLRAVQDLNKAFGDVDTRRMAIGQLIAWAADLARDAVTPLRVVRMRQIDAEFRGLGVGEFVDDLRTSAPPPTTWSRRFDYTWLKSCLDAAILEEPALATFNGRTHHSVVEEFKRLDGERVHLAAARVLRSHAERVIAVRNAHPEQDDLVKREAAKKRRHMPLRKLFTDAPDVLTALHPCWMASPLSVSQLLPGDKQYFDVVIFDEASQVLPEDAATSLLRGRQCVVAGDRRQLPPTTFFAAGGDESGEEEAATAGFESLLDVVTALVNAPWGLDWHYRSRDESLIAFSNHHVYGNRLVTFPGAGGDPAVRHVLVPHVKDSSTEESGSSEVQQVVRLVLEHARIRPQETLGVIAMGIAHARRVEAAIERAMQEHPELESFFDAKKPERFFVKNLERVQGDERDAIILTVGYTKDASGTLPYRFGPLLTEGGERRLNVAITRARCRMTVVSSFSHLDMDPARSKAKGVELLRGFLEYAAKGGTGLSRSTGTDVPLNDFEQDICDALRMRGIDVLPQWGASNYRIDLVAKHPQRPGQFVLAIECDGATYHSSVTARDRDRLRQQHLEALGWQFHRIWSTDWFLNRDQEIARVEEAFRRAVARADAG
ncbi:MAG: AAA domain-containing protein, partial [Burkholderiales bacterium]